MGLDPFQEDVARIALQAAGEHGFALAGANALVAHGIVQRDTQDVDLFSDETGGPGAVTGAVRAALEAAGYEVQVTRPPELNVGEFTRLVVRRGDDAVQLDMARDWRKWPPVQLQVGPVLHVDDAVSSKVTAMVGRRAPRDFIDVGAAVAHGYSRAELMRLAFTRDPGAGGGLRLRHASVRPARPRRLLRLRPRRAGTRRSPVTLRRLAAARSRRRRRPDRSRRGNRGGASDPVDPAGLTSTGADDRQDDTDESQHPKATSTDEEPNRTKNEATLQRTQPTPTKTTQLNQQPKY